MAGIKRKLDTSNDNSEHSDVVRRSHRKKRRKNIQGSLDNKYKDGQIVWARLEDFPWWPATVELVDEDVGFPLINVVPVRWFGIDSVRQDYIARTRIIPFDIKLDKELREQEPVQKDDENEYFGCVKEAETKQKEWLKKQEKEHAKQRKLETDDEDFEPYNKKKKRRYVPIDDEYVDHEFVPPNNLDEIDEDMDEDMDDDLDDENGNNDNNENNSNNDDDDDNINEDELIDELKDLHNNKPIDDDEDEDELNDENNTQQNNVNSKNNDHNNVIKSNIKRIKKRQKSILTDDDDDILNRNVTQYSDIKNNNISNNNGSIMDDYSDDIDLPIQNNNNNDSNNDNNDNNENINDYNGNNRYNTRNRNGKQRVKMNIRSLIEYDHHSKIIEKELNKMEEIQKTQNNIENNNNDDKTSKIPKGYHLEGIPSYIKMQLQQSGNIIGSFKFLTDFIEQKKNGNIKSTIKPVLSLPDHTNNKPEYVRCPSPEVLMSIKAKTRANLHKRKDIIVTKRNSTIGRRSGFFSPLKPNGKKIKHKSQIKPIKPKPPMEPIKPKSPTNNTIKSESATNPINPNKLSTDISNKLESKSNDDSKTNDSLTNGTSKELSITNNNNDSISIPPINDDEKQDSKDDISLKDNNNDINLIDINIPISDPLIDGNNIIPILPDPKNIN